MINIVSVGSSSSGNSYIILAGGRCLILDVGLPAKKILAALAHLGIEPEEVDAVLITHEHTDHVKSVRAVGRKCSGALFFASRGTIEHTENFRYIPEERLRVIGAGDEFVIGASDEDPELSSGQTARETEEYSDNCKDITKESSGGIRIKAFALSHDAAEPLGYTVSFGNEKLAVVTDTGIVTEEIYEAVRGADQLVFEANHDEQMLMFGEYPYPVKMRIKSDLGHLSNVCAAGVLSGLLADRRAAAEAGEDPGSEAGRPLRIMLAHLSFHNNMPLFALQTVEDRLGSDGFIKDEDYTLTVAAREGMTLI